MSRVWPRRPSGLPRGPPAVPTSGGARPHEYFTRSRSTEANQRENPHRVPAPWRESGDHRHKPGGLEWQDLGGDLVRPRTGPLCGGVGQAGWRQGQGDGAPASKPPVKLMRRGSGHRCTCVAPTSTNPHTNGRFGALLPSVNGTEIGHGRAYMGPGTARKAKPQLHSCFS